jgi:glycosyltransferase involved in cell wall biosynthesis
MPDSPSLTVSIPDLSLVIPAYNEARYLPRLLASLAVARQRFAAAGGTMEIIVADNLSTDATAQVAEASGARVVRVERRRIAAARNGGAAAARGAILAFLDADTVRVQPDTFVAIAGARRLARGGGPRGVRWSAGRWGWR